MTIPFNITITRNAADGQYARVVKGSLAHYQSITGAGTTGAFAEIKALLAKPAGSLFRNRAEPGREPGRV